MGGGFFLTLTILYLVHVFGIVGDEQQTWVLGAAVGARTAMLVAAICVVIVTLLVIPVRERRSGTLAAAPA